MYQLIAFDAYGTLFDVYSMGELAETLFPVNGQVFAASWRDRQIEYTRLVTMSDPTPTGSRYYPFGMSPCWLCAMSANAWGLI